MNISALVDPTDAEFMVREVTNEEIKSAMFDLRIVKPLAQMGIPQISSKNPRM